ncbi:MAG: formylglycine-generating enzyme family protein [Anaerolineales bacterium]
MKPTWLLILILALITSGCAPASQDFQLADNQILETGVDPDSWASIPAGFFPSGQSDHQFDLDYEYQIMVTDVTNQQYADYLTQALASGDIQVGQVEVIENENSTTHYGVFGPYPGDPFDGSKHEDPIRAGNKLHYPLEGRGESIAFDGETFSTAPGLANHPLTMVSWFGAQAYCEYFGWHLPSELEWEKAARGTELDSNGHGRAFPWGWEIERNQANYYSSFDLFEKIYGKLGSTTPVGFYNGRSYDGYQTLDQASPYGLYDMAGNVWQWTGDVYPDQHYRYLRGGSFYSYEVDLRVWKGNSAGPTYFAPDVGFRCARSK